MMKRKRRVAVSGGRFMKKTVGTVVSAILILTLVVLSAVFSDYGFSANQRKTMLILLIVCGASVAYCFIVGELAQNFSQMDKLWSILPIVYVWIVAIRGEMKLRLVLYAVIVTIWGIRLTVNFARKGAYKLKFWEGEEDYRWKIVRNRFFKKNVLWTLFDLFFISFYQNALVLAICFPSLAAMESAAALSAWDIAGFALALAFLILETVSDEFQRVFQTKKKELLAENKSLEVLPAPYNLGFNTMGPWGRMRHPNYLGEQGFWVSLYLAAIGAGVASKIFFHWSAIGPLMLVFLFMGSSTLAEAISSKKYPKYIDYIKQVPKYLPIRKFDPEK